MTEKNDCFIEVVNIQLVPDKKIYCDEPLNSPEAAVQVLSNELRKYNRECFAMINLQSDLRVINFNICSIGSINSALVSPAEVFKCALLANAASLIILHNHPSGDPKPSNNDIEVTRRIENGCRLIGLNFVDHIIVGDMDRYYSFKKNKLLVGNQLNLRAVCEIEREIMEKGHDTLKRKTRLIRLIDK